MNGRVVKGLVVAATLCLVFGCKKSENQETSASQDTKSAFVFQKPDYRKAALANVELGLGYLSQGQVVRAKTKLAQAVKLAPNIPESHSAMSYFLEMTGEYREAENQHKKALKLSETKGAEYNNYGAFLCRRDRFKEADRAFNSAFDDKSYVRVAEVYENAGLCAIRAKNTERAKEYLHIAIRRDPNRLTAMLELAELDLKEGKYLESRQLLDRYRGITEPSARSLWLGIQASIGLSDAKRVASDALVLRSLFENSPEYDAYLRTKKAID